MGRMVKRKLVYVDTHVVVWLYQGKKVFTEKVRRLLLENEIKISPMVRMELGLLHEIKRIPHPFEILEVMKNDFEISEEKVDFGKIITKAMSISYTRDPFDRIIIAQAKHSDALLITKDKDILSNFNLAVWE